MIRLSPTGETSVKAKAKCISRPHCALAAPSPTAEATRDANCLRWREKMQIYTPSLLECKLSLLDAPPVGGERRRGVRGTPAEESAGGRGFRRLSPRAPPSARLTASSSPPCARGLDPAYSAPLAPLSAVAAASRAQGPRRGRFLACAVGD